MLGRDVNILGLRNAHAITTRRDRRAAAATRRCARRSARSRSSAQLAIDNLGLSRDVLRSVGAAGEGEADDRRRQAHAARHVRRRDLGDRLADVPDAAARRRPARAGARGARLLAARARARLAPRRCWSRRSRSPRCARSRVTLLMLLALGGFFIELDWARFPQWLLALAAGAVAFAALGVAIGGLAREVRAASLLAFLLSLPIAFLALVPSGAVSAGLYDVMRAVSARVPVQGDAAGARRGAERRGAGPARPARAPRRRWRSPTRPGASAPAARLGGVLAVHVRHASPAASAWRAPASAARAGYPERDALPRHPPAPAAPHRRAARPRPRDAARRRRPDPAAVRHARQRPARADRGDAGRRAADDRARRRGGAPRPPRSGSPP